MGESVLDKLLMSKFQQELKRETEFKCLAVAKLAREVAQLVIYM